MGLIATVTLVVAVLALWSIRHTWGIPMERPAAAAVALLAIDVLIVTVPVTRWVSPKLHALTGVWNIENLIGHICVLAAMCSLLYLVADRLDMTTSQFRWFIRARIELPATLAIALMTATFLVGPISDYYVDDPVTVEADVTPWLRAYWLTMSVGCYYLLWNIARVLLILRRDPQSRRAATAYLIATGVSASCGVAFALGIEPLAWVMVRAELIAYAVAASYSWHRKVSYLRGR
jgi:hypothetical protein